jgi:PPK2 family polyphosphate:nucleotide phosphotransferase
MVAKESNMPSKFDKLHDLLVVPPGKKINLRKDYDPSDTGGLVKKKEAQKLLADGILQLAEQQNMLYAQNNYSLLIVLQAMDAAGKDGVIKHVMSGVNPQGTQVFSFKAPSAEELDHDYLWRNYKTLPERGNIGIFNRSYYEEVLVARVHPEILERQQLPPHLKDKGIWKRRFTEINNFEEYLVNNGMIVLKFFLNVSKAEQKKRFLERIDRPEKNWKFSSADAKERQRWDDYQAAYEDVLNHTSTQHAPWYVIPADHKWFSRLAVGAVILQTMRDLKLAYPTIGETQKQELLKAKEMLESEE